MAHDTNQRDAETVSASSCRILGGLEPIRHRPDMYITCANPVLHCNESLKVLRAVVDFEDVLLMSFRHYKVQIAIILRRLKRFTKSYALRARHVLSAIASLSLSSLPACPDAYQRCLRFLMLTAQHDDAIQDCPAAGLSIF